MRLRFHPPFDFQKGWIEVPLSKSLTVREFLSLLKEKFPEMAGFIKESEEETFHSFLILRGDYVFTSKDMVKDDDSIEIMMPLTGGGDAREGF